MLKLHPAHILQHPWTHSAATLHTLQHPATLTVANSKKYTIPLGDWPTVQWLHEDGGTIMSDMHN